MKLLFTIESIGSKVETKMRFAYNRDTYGLINGILVFFDAGDELPMSLTLSAISLSAESPTSIVWCGRALSKEMVIRLFWTNAGEFLRRDAIGMRFTVESEANLLWEVLGTLETNIPTLAEFARCAKAEVFGCGYPQ